MNLFLVNSFCTSRNEEPVLTYKYFPSSGESVDPKNFQAKKPVTTIRTVMTLSMIFFFIDMDNKVNKKPCRFRQGIKKKYTKVNYGLG